MERAQLTLTLGHNPYPLTVSTILRQVLDLVNCCVKEHYHEHSIAFTEDVKGLSYLLPSAQANGFYYSPSTLQHKQPLCDLYTLKFVLFTTSDKAVGWPKSHFGTQHNTDSVKAFHQLRTLFVEFFPENNPTLVLSISNDEYGAKILSFIEYNLGPYYNIAHTQQDEAL